MKIRIGDKIIDVELKNGVPTIRATTEEIKHPDGRVDIIVHVPCMKLTGKG